MPIKDNAHWYLMVVCIEEQVIYHFDSHLELDAIEPWREIIKTLVIFANTTNVYKLLFFKFDIINDQKFFHEIRRCVVTNDAISI